jgi:uncharacterized phage protein gp47/JayE
MITLAQLLQKVSPTEVEETLLTFLSGFGFQATSWQPGSIQRTLIQGFADKYSALTGVVADQAAAFSPKLSRGTWQDALGEHVYDLTRVPARATEGTFLLSLSVAAAPVAWDADELVIADAENSPAQSYRVSEAGALNPGESLRFTVRAEIPGAAGNIPNNAPLYFWTPITGLSAVNTAPAGSSSWITSQGQDSESNERYAERMIGRWSRLSYGNTEGAYRAWAFEALPELTRVKVIEGDDPGEVRVIGATATGGLTGAQITAIDNYIHGVTDGVGRRPLNDVVSIESATAKTTPAIVLTLYCEAALASTAAARVSAALVSTFGAVNIGGDRIAPDPGGYVHAATIYRTVMAQQGIVNVTGIPPDIPIGSTEIYAPPIILTVVAT